MQSTKNRMRRLLTILSLGVLLLGGAAGCGGGGGEGTAAAPGDFPRIEFEHDITDIAHITLIVPPGSLSGDEVKPHSYMRTDGSTVPIYAPTDMTLTQGTWVGGSDDYGLVFEINARYRIILGHIDEPRADIVSRISRADPSSRFEVLTPLLLRAGELIGTVTGTAAPFGFDFGFYDLAVEVITDNTPRYRTEMFWQKRHSVCPYAYFSAALRSAYAARLGTIGGVPVPGGPCRRFGDQYAAGSIAGEWTLLSHAPDATYHRQFGIGTHLDGGAVRIAGINGGAFDVIGGVDPKTVTTDICYESGGSYVFLRMTSPTTLDAVSGSGPCPAVFPAGAQRTYER